MSLFRACCATLAAAVLATASLSADRPAARTGASATEIRGQVLGPATEQAPQGAPVAKAKVAVAVTDPQVARRSGETPPPVTGETGPDGKFAIAGLPGTSFTVRVQAPGLAPFEVQEVGPGAMLQIRLKPGQRLAGRVVDATARKPVAGVTVLARTRAARGMPEEMLPQAVTDAEGRFELADLAPGVVDVEARGATWARAAEEGVAVPGRAPLELVVRPGGRLAGRVVDLDGKPVEGASVRLEPVAIERLREVLRMRPARTDARGAFAFDGLLPGDGYRLHATKKGLSSASAGPFPIEPGKSREDVELRLDPSAGLRVRLLDPEGKPVRALEVAVHPPTEGRARGPRGNDVAPDQVADEGEGRFHVTGLLTGTATVELLPDGFAAIERKDVKLVGGKTLDLGTLTAREGRTLRGRVVDLTGAPVAGATVRGFWSVDNRFRNRQVRSDADGRFRMAGVGEGALQTVMVTAKGFASKTENGVSTDQELEVALERAGVLVGRVVLDESGDPVPARVEATAEAKAETMGGMRFQFGFDEDVYADASGSFRLEDLVPGKYTLIATAPGRAPARVQGLEVRAEDVADAGTVRLKEGLSLRGRVLDVKDDSPIAGAAVGVDEPRGMMRFGLGEVSAHATMSDPQGGFEVRGLEAKTYEITVQHPEYARGDARAEAQEGSPEVVVRLSRGGALTGTVRDGQRVPVPGATVMAMQGMSGSTQSAVTGPDGVYKVERMAPGSYRAIRLPEGNRIMIGPGMKSVDIREGEVSVLDFDDAAKITLTGRVLRGDRPVGSAMLLFFPGASPEGIPSEMKTAQAESDGRFQIGLDRPGLYTVLVQAMGDFRSRSTAQVEVPDEAQVSRDIVLSRGGIAGTVSGSDGEPVGGASVQATPDPPPATPTFGGSGAQTKADGTYSIEGLEPGTYKVRAVAQGRRPGVASGVVSDEGGLAQVDLRLEPGSPLRGRVLDPQGNGLQGVLVFAAPAGVLDPGAGTAGTTDVNGTFEIIAPGDGPLDLTALPPGYAPARASVGAPSEDEIQIRATPGGRIRIRVTGPDGKGREGIQPLVIALPAFLGSGHQTAASQRSTDSTGTVVADLLAPGAYSVKVANRGDVPPATVQVSEGAEAAVSLVVP